MLIPNIYVLGCFVKFVVIVGYIFGDSHFSQRVSKIYGNRKSGRFDVVLKLEFEVKNRWTCSKQNAVVCRINRVLL